jgi:hypothetical protein
MKYRQGGRNAFCALYVDAEKLEHLWKSGPACPFFKKVCFLVVVSQNCLTFPCFGDRFCNLRQLFV